ncbi:MAG: hypothetical protein ACLVBX_06870 [Faecalibacterium prausnitzii]
MAAQAATKSSAKVTIEGDAKVTAENSAYGGGAGIGGGANGTGKVIIGGKAQVKATGSAEKHEDGGAYGAGAAIGDGGTAGWKSSDTVQNGKNQFTIANDIEDNAKIEMTNVGHNNSSNTMTQTRRNGEWVTSGNQTPEGCDHSNPSVEITVAPTCTESGYTVSKCTRCGKETGERTDIVPLWATSTRTASASAAAHRSLRRTAARPLRPPTTP